MKLHFKQRLFSWFDSYDIFDAQGSTVYTVSGQLAWGHKFKIYNAAGEAVGTVRQRVLTLLPCFELYDGSETLCYGTISKEFTLLRPRYTIDCSGWYVEGDFWEWDYRIFGPSGETVATVSKELLHWTDTYTIDILDPRDALLALMLVLAIDAEKCSRSS